MLEVIIGILLLWIIILITWQYLSINIIIILITFSILLIASKLFTNKSKQSKKQNNLINHPYQLLNINIDDCAVYVDPQIENHQYEINKVMLEEYSHNKDLKTFGGLSNSTIIKENYTLSNPVYKFKQNFITQNITLQLDNLDDGQSVAVYYSIEGEDDFLLFRLEGEQAREIFVKQNQIENYGLRIRGGNVKYSDFTSNNVRIVKKISQPYEVDLLIQYKK